MRKLSTKPSVRTQSLLMASGPRALFNDFDAVDTELQMRLTLPPDLVSVDSLVVHLVLEFDNDTAAGDRKLLSVAVKDALTSPTWNRSLTINKSADANRRVEQFLDLGALLNPAGDNWVCFKVPAAAWGRVHLFKQDMLVTTADVG